MFKQTIISLLLVALGFSLFAQKSITINLNNNKLRQKSLQKEKVHATSEGFILRESFSSIQLTEKVTKEGIYRQLSSEGMNKSYDAGKPELPVFSRLIDIPVNATAKVKILNYEEQVIDLKDHNILKEIIPAQPSVEKSKNPKDIPFYKDQKLYRKNSFYKKELLTFTDKGYLRNKHLGYIEISPFHYNPVKNTLKVINNIEVEVTFIHDNKKEIDTKSLQSPYFNNIATNTINKIESSKAIIEGPVKYVIVSDPMFEETLQAFIEWKTMKGFHVVEAYTDDAEIGNTTTSIKAYLKDLYENPFDGISPSFVLFVGDVDQIPAFDGTAGTANHVTDLYYCEYTDDMLPEVFYGRFSATTVKELQPQIDKTLEVEKYKMPDPSYLDNALVVAGHDHSGHDTIQGNGFVNYATQYYLNSTNGINTYSYLSPESQGLAGEIRSKVSSGVAIANYTAHCNSNGWADPAFTNTHVPSMTNEHMYPLMIGNCCLSNKFDDASCFGETLLRAEGKGAVGYIGASNNSLWDEDFYWGVGLTTVSKNPNYASSGLGAYDRFFHLNGEPKEDWYITQGQMIVAGNLAVEESSSAKKAYYWEIYHLMGDPSLMPTVKVPGKITASWNPEISVGSTSFTVNAEENAYVALSLDGVLLDAKLTGFSETVELNFNSLNFGKLHIVITKHNKQPIIDSMDIISHDEPSVTFNEYSVTDIKGKINGKADYADSLNLNIKLKNISDKFDAFKVSSLLTTTDTNVVITNNTEVFDTILMSTIKLKEPAFTIHLKDYFKNQQKIEFKLSCTGEDSLENEYTWESFFDVAVNAPELNIKNYLIDDKTGNDNGILDANETANLRLVIENKGHSDIEGLSSNISLLDNSSDYLILNTSEVTNITLDTESTDTIDFNISAKAGVQPGTFAYLGFTLNDNNYNSYSVSENKDIEIGALDTILISDERTVTVYNSLFYDSGGKSSDYSHNEKDTITFIPSNPGEYIQVEFFNFMLENAENCSFDNLKVFDGLTTGDNLIETYCGSNLPGKITATNPDGALTFVFESDKSVTKLGWEAQVKCLPHYSYELTVLDEGTPIDRAKVNFDGQIQSTGTDGKVLFSHIPKGINLPLSVKLDGFENYFSEVTVFENSIGEITLVPKYYEIRFHVNSLNTSKPIENATINFKGQTVYTNSNGQYSFNDLRYKLNESYTVSKDQYFEKRGYTDVTKNKNIYISLDTINYTLTFKVQSSNNLNLDNVKITFNSEVKYTNREGIAIFERVYPSKGMGYTLTRERYNDISGKVDLSESTNLTITMSLFTGIEKIDITENIKLYPNPSQGLFNLEINNKDYYNYIVNIYNIVGIEVYNKEIKGNSYIKEEIDITDQQKGIYFMTVKTKEGIILNRKLLIY